MLVQDRLTSVYIKMLQVQEAFREENKTHTQIKIVPNFGHLEN